jgi:hypothetical protein
VAFSYAVSGSTSTTATTAAGPGQVITITGSPNATASIPGPQQDSADFYGIVLVILAIAVALFATRWIFGRGARPRR